MGINIALNYCIGGEYFIVKIVNKVQNGVMTTSQNVKKCAAIAQHELSFMDINEISFVSIG